MNALLISACGLFERTMWGRVPPPPRALPVARRDASRLASPSPELRASTLPPVDKLSRGPGIVNTQIRACTRGAAT